jgi:stalled ribosome rescue protein Dom34
MSFLGIHILTDAQLKTLKDAGHEIATIALTDAQKAVAALKETDLGKTVAADIAAVAGSGTATQKFENVVAATMPEVLKLVASGGVTAALADVESITREFVQSVFNDTKSSTAGKIASALLAVLKIVTG